jgi:hypothetical protein
MVFFSRFQFTGKPWFRRTISAAGAGNLVAKQRRNCKVEMRRFNGCLGKLEFLFEYTAGEDFNRRNILNISRIKI